MSVAPRRKGKGSDEGGNKKPHPKYKSSEFGDTEYNQIEELLKTEEAGYLEADEGEETRFIQQEALLNEVPLQAAKKKFTLRLNEGGRYNCQYSRDGKNLLLAGRKGHVAAIGWEKGNLNCELELDEVVRAATWLQSDQFFALAQEKYVYVYDGQGAQLHRLNKHQEVDFLEYLPYHFLLTSIGSEGILRYQDVTHGQIVGEVQSKHGRCKAMRQNPQNAVIHVGHTGGFVTLWSPSVNGPLATIQCHNSPLTSIAVDSTGNLMATSGLDGHLRVWDLRTWKRLYEHGATSQITSLDFSQRGLLAASAGSRVFIWDESTRKYSKKPYMHHQEMDSQISCVRFCPFEDILGLGSTKGFSSIIIPGAGEPNFDSFEINPVASKKHRREAQVKQLLDKLPPETIMLDPSVVGKIAQTEDERHAIKADIEFTARNSAKAVRKKQKRTRPRKSELAKMERRKNIISEDSRDEIVYNNANKTQQTIPEKPSALDRFKVKLQ